MLKRISKIYIFFWRHPAISLLLSFIKGVATGIALMSLVGCSPKYEVVQKLRLNLYHLQNVKTKEVEIILTEKELREGQTVKLKNIKQIQLDDSHYRYQK